MSSSENFEKEVLLITLDMYNNQGIPRSVIQKYIDTLVHLSKKMMMEYVFKETAKSPNCDGETLEIFKHVFQIHVDILGKFDSEYKRLELYKKRGLLLMPQEFALEQLTNTSSAQHLSLPWTLKLLLEIPGSFELLINYMKQLEKEHEVISSFIQGSYWRSVLQRSRGRIIIPLFILHDDFTCGNAFGAHAEESMLGDVFISLPGYPPHISSKISNLFLTDLFYAKDRKQFGNNAVFSMLIRDLKLLVEDGLNIQVENGSIQVYFDPSLYIGDNKGLNEDLGVTPSFIHGCCCRLCKADANMMKTKIIEDLSLLRTEENYESDLRMKCPSQTGLLENCCFHQVGVFHILRNTAADLMHDEFEGNSNNLLAKILNDMIYRDRTFELEWLNEQIENFNKNTSDISNKIPEIKKQHLKAGKLKMSSAEMMTFVRFFALIVGEKFEDSDSKIWKLFLLYREITDYLLSPRFVEGHLVRLDTLSPKFLALFIKLYEYLIFKLHMMIHLVRSLRKFGPLIHYWAMHLETKHRELKAVATTTCNTKNLLKTISLRSQLKLAHLKATGCMHVKDVEFDCHEEISEKDRRSYFAQVPYEIPIVASKHVVVKGIEVAVGKMFVMEMGENDRVVFGLVENIFIVNEDVFLLMRPHTKIYFDRDLYSYYVKARNVLVIENIKNLPNIHSCALSKLHGSLYVTPKYAL